MTAKQRLILQYTKTQFRTGTVKIYPESEDQVRVVDKTGAELALTADQHGNILDAATNEVIAERSSCHLWRNLSSWSGYAGDRISDQKVIKRSLHR